MLPGASDTMQCSSSNSFSGTHLPAAKAFRQLHRQCRVTAVAAPPERPKEDIRSTAARLGELYMPIWRTSAVQLRAAPCHARSPRYFPAAHWEGDEGFSARYVPFSDVKSGTSTGETYSLDEVRHASRHSS